MAKFRIPFTNITLGEREPDRPTEPGDEQARKLDELDRLCDQSRSQHIQEWMDNLACMYGRTAGQDRYERDALGATRRMPKPPPSRPIQVKDNIALSLLRNAQAFLLDSLGTPVCVPASESAQHRVQAEIGTDFLGHEHNRNAEREQRDWELQLAIVMGRALAKVEWDPTAKGEGRNGKAVPGDILRTTLMPLQFKVDPWHARFRDATFVVESQVWDVDEIEARFGKRVSAQGYEPTSGRVDQVLGMGGRRGTQAPKREHCTLLKTFTFKQCDEIPDGLVVHTASGVTLWEGPLPDNLWPYVELAWFRGVSSYPIPFLSPIRVLQYYYETVLSQELQLVNSQLRGDAAIQGEGIVTIHVDEETGQRTIQIPDGAQSWKLMTYPLESASGKWAIEKMLLDLERLSGMSAITGQNTAGVRTIGQQMQLEEPSIKGLQFFREGFDQAYAQIDWIKVQLAKKHYKTERLVRVVGADSKVKKVDAFLGSDLEGVAEVRVTYVPAMSEIQKRVAKEQLNDPAHRAYGPYLDPATGQFSLQVMAAGVREILNSGIPDAHDEAESVTYPMTLNEFWDLVARDKLEKIKISIVMQKLQMVALMQQAQPREEGQEQPGGAMQDEQGAPMAAQTTMAGVGA